MFYNIGVSTPKTSLDETPKVDYKTALLLWVKAGGRCSFHGCNEYLLRDNLSMDELKQGNIAHIVAGKKNGPRGDDPLPYADRSKINNLMLVCQRHHSVIDNPELVEKYPRELLRAFKKQHEEHIYELTGCRPDQRTRVIRVLARVGGEMVSASYSQICSALLAQGRFPREKDVIDIDLTQHPSGDSQSFLEYSGEIIRKNAYSAYEAEGLSGGEIGHVSVFAIGSIPLLVYLGSQLSNKVPTDLYQRHRDTQDWLWSSEPGKVRYVQRLVREGTDRSKVALILSLSGKLTSNQLPKLEGFYIYEITLDGQLPSTDFLRSKSDLEGFRSLFQGFLGHVRSEHSSAETVHLFPAMPAPVAVICGRELLHKIPPSLSVYDRSRGSGGFRFVLEVT